MQHHHQRSVRVNEDRRGSISGEWIIRDRSGGRGKMDERIGGTRVPHLVWAHLSLSLVLQNLIKILYPSSATFFIFIFSLSF